MARPRVGGEGMARRQPASTAAASLSLTDTVLETPFSSITTPYSASQRSMVPLRWVMTMNWVFREYAFR